MGTSKWFKGLEWRAGGGICVDDIAVFKELAYMSSVLMSSLWSSVTYCESLSLDPQCLSGLMTTWVEEKTERQVKKAFLCPQWALTALYFSATGM